MIMFFWQTPVGSWLAEQHELTHSSSCFLLAKMAAPQVIGNHDPNLSTQCLEFIQTLVNQNIGFNFQLTSGQFSCSFDSNRTVTAAASARNPSEVRKKSPSTRRRNLKRLQLFLENKKSGSTSVDCENTAQSACEKPPQQVHKEPPQPSAQKEPTQLLSDSLWFPSSSESPDLASTDHGGGCITKKMRMDVVPPLKVLVNRQASSPKYRIQQFDGNCSLSDLSICENEPMEHDDDSNMDQLINCPLCDQILTSTFHQCEFPHNPDSPHLERDTYILTLEPFLGPHNEQCVKEQGKWKKDTLRFIESTSSDERITVFKSLLCQKQERLFSCFCSDNQLIHDFSDIHDLLPILALLS